jgi:hypothetical protein
VHGRDADYHLLARLLRTPRAINRIEAMQARSGTVCGAPPRDREGGSSPSGYMRSQSVSWFRFLASQAYPIMVVVVGDEVVDVVLTDVGDAVVGGGIVVGGTVVGDVSVGGGAVVEGEPGQVGTVVGVA